MEYTYSLSAKSPLVKKYRIMTGTTQPAGVPVIANSLNADDDGIIACAATTAVACVGYSIDEAISTSAQVATGGGQRGDGINAGFQSVIINPDAIMRAKLTEGLTADTALTIITQTSDSAAGTTVGPTTTDEFTVWGYQGANAGHARRCTAANTVVNAFPFSITAGDEFLEAGFNIGARDHFAHLTTIPTQYNANAAADTDNDNFLVVDAELNDIANDGRNNSYVHLVAAHHAFSGSHTAGT